ncbi:MAG: glycosyltransferase family 2 protein [Cyanophyceae cyanobacterium]
MKVAVDFLPQQAGSTQPDVTVAIVSYNGKKVIQACLDSILAQTYRQFKVLLINNASTDGTPDWVSEHYPQVEILHHPENKGPNPARNLALKKSFDALVLLVDDDAVLEKDCLAELVKAYQAYPSGAIWAPRLIYNDKRNTIQHEGVFIHYVSEAILVNAEKHITEGLQTITPVSVISGTCLLISKPAAQKVGLFDEDYFFGRTDGEFTFRLTLSGYKLYTVPQAVTYHRVKRRGLSKVFYQVRNRWYFTLTMYSWRTLLLSLPALLLYEIFLILFLLSKGALKEYLTAVSQVIINFPVLWRKRKSIQSLRTVADREVLRSGSINMRSDLLNNRLIAFSKNLLDGFFNIYWQLIYQLI